MRYRFRLLLDRVMWRLGYRRRSFVYQSIDRELIVSCENDLKAYEWANMTGCLAQIVGISGNNVEVTITLSPPVAILDGWVVEETEATK